MTQMKHEYDLWNRNRIVDIENRLVVAKEEWGGRGEKMVAIFKCLLCARHFASLVNSSPVYQIPIFLRPHPEVLSTQWLEKGNRATAFRERAMWPVADLCYI